MYDIYPTDFPESVINFFEKGVVNSKALSKKKYQLIGDDLFSYLLKKKKADRNLVFNYGKENAVIISINYYLHPESDHHSILVDFHYDHPLNNNLVKGHRFTKSILDTKKEVQEKE